MDMSAGHTAAPPSMAWVRSSTCAATGCVWVGDTLQRRQEWVLVRDRRGAATECARLLANCSLGRISEQSTTGCTTGALLISNCFGSKGQHGRQNVGGEGQDGGGRAWARPQQFEGKEGRSSPPVSVRGSPP